MTVIAMTQEMGTLGKDVATGVAQALGLSLVRHEIGDQVADRLRVNRSLVRRAREGQAGWLERRSYDQESFALYGAEQVFEYALKDDVLIRGWGATSLLQGIPGIPCIRVCAPMENRVRWLMERLGTEDEELARGEIERSDAAHGARIRHNFGVDWHDPLQYHLVLNTGRVSVEGCVAQVVHLARLPEFARTQAGIDALADRVLEARVRTAFRATPEGADINVSVVANAGAVALRGMVAHEEERQLAEDLARNVDGVASVDNQLRVIRGTKVFPTPDSGGTR
ncbi:MAG: cytidylate kinase family protein [Rudaea sp.]